MITLTGSHANLEGTSGDNKPLDVAYNTIFLELDTGDFYFFDDDDTWKKVGYNEEGSLSISSLSLGMTASPLGAVPDLGLTREISAEPEEIEEDGDEGDPE